MPHPLPAQADLAQPVSTRLHRDAVPLSPGQTVGQALASLRASNLGERIVYFYVVDGDGRLRGVVPTRRLLMAPLDQAVEQLMVRNVIAVPMAAALGEASAMLVAHRFLALPVVDETGRFQGTLDAAVFADNLHDINERQSVDDVYQLIGVRLAHARTAWSSFADRFPWLLANIGGGLAAAVIASLYEGLLNRVLTVALFIPVVLALAESVSVQSVTLTLQELHGPAHGLASVTRALARELKVALLLGSAAGAVVGTVAWAWQGSLPIAWSIGGSIAFSMVTACLLGVALPTLLRVAGRNPRIAAGPIVLATADLATLVFYFNVSLWLLG